MLCNIYAKGSQGGAECIGTGGTDLAMSPQAKTSRHQGSFPSSALLTLQSHFTLLIIVQLISRITFGPISENLFCREGCVSSLTYFFFSPIQRTPSLKGHNSTSPSLQKTDCHNLLQLLMFFCCCSFFQKPPGPFCSNQHQNNQRYSD